MTVRWSSLRLSRLSATTRSCPPEADDRDIELARFLTSPLTWRSDGTVLTLDSAASGPFSSAEFTRDR